MGNSTTTPEADEEVKEKLLKKNAEILERSKPSDCLLFSEKEKAKEGILETNHLEER